MLAILKDLKPFTDDEIILVKNDRKYRIEIWCGFNNLNRYIISNYDGPYVIDEKILERKTFKTYKEAFQYAYRQSRYEYQKYITTHHRVKYIG